MTTQMGKNNPVDITIWWKVPDEGLSFMNLRLLSPPIDHMFHLMKQGPYLHKRIKEIPCLLA